MADIKISQLPALAQGDVGATTDAVPIVHGATTYKITPSALLLGSLTGSTTGTGSIVLNTSPTLVTPALGTPSSGVATNLTGLPLTTGVTGTLPVANGGTGLGSYTANGVLYASGAGTLANGSALVFDGTKLGIGTSSPGSKLSVAGTAGSAVINLLETGVRSWAIRAGGAVTNTFDIADLTAGQTRLTLDSSGNLGIGSGAVTVAKLRIGGTATGSSGIYNDVQFDPALATTVYSNTTQLRTATGAINKAIHYNTIQGTFTGTVTSQYGFTADSTLTGATNNYGFFSNIAAATGRWNFYANGTADNYFGGGVGIGTTSIGGFSGTVNLGGNGSPTSGYLEGFASAQTATSSVTVRMDAFLSAPSTAAASFTLTGLRHFTAQQGTFGVGSTVTNQYGFFVGTSLTGATNNYGFYSDIASGANRWNFYASGTAPNYFNGNIGVGTTSFGTSAALVIGIANGTAPSTSPAGMGQLYVEAGALKYRGSGGTITTIAAA